VQRLVAVRPGEPPAEGVNVGRADQLGPLVLEEQHVFSLIGQEIEADVHRVPLDGMHALITGTGPPPPASASVVARAEI
jgi:galactokinase